MPGITIKNELRLFRIKPDNLVNRIEENFFRIEMKNTLWGIHDLMILQISYIDELIEELVQYHIEYIEDFLKEVEDLENLTNTQRERAKTLLKPFQGLIRIEQMISQVGKDSAGNNTAPNLVSEPVLQS